MLKLLPCRPTFAHDISDAERGIMQQHLAYWREWMVQGKLLFLAR